MTPAKVVSGWQKADLLADVLQTMIRWKTLADRAPAHSSRGFGLDF